MEKLSILSSPVVHYQNDIFKQGDCDDIILMELTHITINSAVYTGIKKPESFSHSGFSEVARQLLLNTPKNPNRKTHLRHDFFETAPKNSLVFWNVSLQSRRYYSRFLVTWYVSAESLIFYDETILPYIRIRFSKQNEFLLKTRNFQNRFIWSLKLKT